MADDARTALETLKSALDAHLTACEARSGENDPTVQAAYDVLRRAAEGYDDALFDAYEEVTPFEFVDVPQRADGADDEEPDRVGLFVRRDYAVRDVDELLAGARRASAQAWPDGAGPVPAEDVETAGRAVYELIHANGVDGLDEMAEDIGLDPIGGSLWVVAQDADDETLTSAPFDAVDEERLLYRIDEVFEG